MYVIQSMFSGHHLGEIVSILFAFLGVGGAIAPPIVAAITSAMAGTFVPGLCLLAGTSLCIPLALILLPKEKPNIYGGSSTEAVDAASDPFNGFGPRFSSPAGDHAPIRPPVAANAAPSDDARLSNSGVALESREMNTELTTPMTHHPRNTAFLLNYSFRYPDL